MSWHGAFSELTAKTHTEQGIWWLNGFWDDGAEAYAEDIWKTVHAFIELDIGRPLLYGGRMPPYTEGCDLDEMNSHMILEKLGQTMTVLALRKRLKELDIDNNKRMAISEFLLDHYKKVPEVLVKSPQGTVDPAELNAAQQACEDAGNAMSQAAADADAAAEALSASKKAAADAAETEEEAVAAADAAASALQQSESAEATVRAAEAELQAAIDEITALEQANADKIAKCQAVIDSDASVVKKGRAKQDMEAVLAEDPLPLRKAKITQGAALKKVTKARKIAEQETAKSAAAKRASDDAAAAAAAAKVAAEEAAVAAAEAKTQADAAKVAAEEALAAAEQALQDLRSKGTGNPMGRLWWMERVLAEKKKFMK